MKKIVKILASFGLLVGLSSCDLINQYLPTTPTTSPVQEAYETITKSFDKNNVTDNLTLPSRVDGVDVAYESNDPSVLDNNGNVTRQETDKVVYLTITLTYEGKTTEEIIKVVVKGDSSQHDSTKENKDKARQIVEEIAHSIPAKLTENISLPTSKDGATVIYSSSNTNALSNTGVVTRGESDVSVELTISATYAGETVNGTVTVVVSKKDSGGDTPPVNPPSSDLTLDMLRDALDIEVNYKVSCSIAWDYQEDDDYDDSDSVVYVYDDNKLQCTYDDYEYFLEIKNDKYYLTFDEDGEYYTLSEDDDDFNTYWYYGACDEFLFEDIDYTAFTVNGDHYSCKSSDLTKQGQYVIGEYEGDTIKSFDIYLSNGKLSSIEIKTLYLEQDVGGTYHCDYTYTMNFSKFGECSVTIPTGKTLEEDDNEVIDIKDVYDVEDGTDVAIEGYVTGFSSKYIYLADDTGTILVYTKDYTAEVGDFVSVSGTKTTYSGLVEIKDIENFEDAEAPSYSAPKNDTITDISALNNTLKQGKVINLYGVSVETTYAKKSSSSDYTLTVNDGTNSIVVFVKSSNSTLGTTLFKSLKVGDKISMQNVAVVWHDGVQLQITDQTELFKGAMLTANNTDIKVDYMSDEANALNGLEVTYTDENGLSTVLTSSDYEVTTPTGFDTEDPDTYEFVITYNELTLKVYVTVKAAPRDSFIDATAEKLHDVCGDNDITIGLPCEGDVNVLVLPISFSDVRYQTKYGTNVMDVLETGFNGTSEQTGWESLKSYYSKASYGKLNITATIADIYDTGKKYSSSYSYEDWDDIKLFKNALTAAASKMDLTKFDNNDDGLLDCVYVVYLADYDAEDDESIFWAYTSQLDYTAPDIGTFDGLEMDYYMFLSYQFFIDPIQDTEDGHKEWKEKYVTVNSETIIHETGHALGLNDYYDYDESKGPDGGLGGGAMMDYNVGDHDPFSKAILGWISPKIVTNKDETFTLNSFESSGDAIIIAKEWNGTYFDEYYIVDFFTPTGVNEINKGYHGLFSITGVAIYHVMAEVEIDSETSGAYDITKYDNSYTTYKQLALVEADGNNSIVKQNSYSNNTDLFQATDTFAATWYGEKTTAFTLTVDSTSSTSATISISF